MSLGVYSSLNLRSAGKDSIKNVENNKNIVCKNLSLDSKKVYKARQNHTDNILILNNENKEKYKYENYNLEEYDAYIIDDKNISNFITTADCNPIIIYDTKQNIVANVHAGWRGVLSRIYLKVVKILVEKFNTKLEDLVVCIGPSIRKCCFSSKDENFKEKFTKIWKNQDDYISYESDLSTFHIDLIYIIKEDLIKFGVLDKNIQVADICTCCNSADFYSYRFATKNKQEDYATFSTWVSLK